MISTTYQVDGFPEDNDSWRIEWFGGISYNPRVPSEHLIEVALARVPPSAGSKIHPKYLSLRTERKNVQVGIGYLPYLALGTLWQEGHPDARELMISEKSFQIDVDKQHFISADTRVNGDWVIAPSRYPFGDNWQALKDTMLVAIEYGGSPYGLLIPAIELFRFYYATSTDLTKAACWGDIQKIYDHKESRRLGDGNFKIHLKQNLSKHDAWTLARYIESPEMQHQMEQFHRQIQTTQINAGSIPVKSVRAVKCGFPFSGKTTIRGRALNISSDAAKPRWLVLRLTGCTYPLPFGDVVADWDDNYINIPIDEHDEEEGSGVDIPVYPPGKKRKPSNKLKSNVEPSRRWKPLEIQLPEDRFDGLKGKKLITAPGKERKVHFRVVSTTTEIIDGFGSGDGTWGNSNLRPVRLQNVPQEKTPQPPKQKKPLPVDIANFMAAMHLLREKHGFTGSFIGVSDNNIHVDGSVFSTFPRRNPDTNRLLKWPVLDNGELRRLVVARIVSNGEIAYALEMERGAETENYSTLVVALKGFGEMSKAEWKKFLQQCILNKRWPTKSETRNMRRASTSHKGLVSADVFADRLWTCVVEVLGIEVGS